MMDVFKHSLRSAALRLRHMQNSLISQQDILVSKPCSGLWYTPVLRGGLSTVKGIWLFYPKHELRTAVNKLYWREKSIGRFIGGVHVLLCYKSSGVLSYNFLLE